MIPHSATLFKTLEGPRTPSLAEQTSKPGLNALGVMRVGARVRVTGCFQYVLFSKRSSTAPELALEAL